MAILAKLLPLLLIYSVVDARTFIIPNLYKNKREIQGSGVATAWSTRKITGIEISSIKTEINSTTGTNENSQESVRPYVICNCADRLGIEAEFSKSKNEFNSGTSESDVLDFSLNAGYSFLNMAVGFQVGNEKTDTKGVESADQNIGLSYGVKLSETFLIGLGYEATTESADKTKDKDGKNYFFGVGGIYGGLEKPKMAWETVLSVGSEGESVDEKSVSMFIFSGLMNLGDSELQSLIAYYKFEDDNNESSDITLVGLTLDHDFNPFYLAPTITYNKGKSDIGLTSEYSTLGFILEGGYRAEGWSTYLSYGSGKTDLDYPGGYIDTKVKTLLAGFNMQF